MVTSEMPAMRTDETIKRVGLGDKGSDADPKGER